jgi:hypothetical protein
MIDQEKVQRALDAAFANEISLLFSTLYNNMINERGEKTVAPTSEQRFERGYGILTAAYDVAKRITSS